MRTPDKIGAATRAWTLPIEEQMAKAHTPDEVATLAMWLVEAPWAHLAWDKWLVSIIHLRDIPNVKEAKKKYPEAEYELMVAALDPQHPIDLDNPRWIFLQPVDLVEQFHGVDDAVAVHIIELLVDRVVAGVLSPDSDYRRAWQELLRSTVEHYTEGHGGTLH